MDFRAIHMPKYLTEDEEERPSKQKKCEIKLKKYIDREDIIQENKNKRLFASIDGSNICQGRTCGIYR